MNSIEQYQKAAANAYANNLGAAIGGLQPATQVAAPRTVASALARMDGLNEKLAELRKHMSHVAELIGGPSPVAGNSAKDQPPASGAVGRLNESAEAAHWQVAELADLLAAIHRALG